MTTLPLTTDTDSDARPHGDAAFGRRITITDVARVAGVSRTTVSYVLSGRDNTRVPEVTRRRIEDAARAVGYRRNALAIALRSGRMNTIGIVAPLSMIKEDAAGSVYYRDLILALAAASSEAGLNPLLLAEETGENLSLASVTDRRVDGVIVVVKSDTEAFVREARVTGVPCVTVGREFGEWQVHTDNTMGAQLAVEHLLSLGHERMAYLWHGKEGIPSGRARRDGFLAALQDAGIAAGPNAVFTDQRADPLLAAVARPDGPTAVFCYNDELAARLLMWCRDRGVRVPEDLSVVGFDDNVIATCVHPRLTTVHNPLNEIGAKAIELFRAQLRGEAVPDRPALVPPTLTVRASTAPPSSHRQPRPGAALPYQGEP